MTCNILYFYFSEKEGFNYEKTIRSNLCSNSSLGVTTAFAANPFSDVTPDSWAYQAVSQLANAGVINGYPDGTFKGQK